MPSKPDDLSFDDWESLGFPDAKTGERGIDNPAFERDKPYTQLPPMGLSHSPGDLAQEPCINIDISASPESRPDNQGISEYYASTELANSQGVKRILYERVPGQNLATGWVLYECKCGNIFWARNQLFHAVLNCGCAPPAGKPDLTGQRFGKLTALRFQRGMGWECQCDCGNKRWVGYGQLDKLIRSCGQCKRTGSRPATELMQIPKPILNRLRFLKAATGRPMTQLLEEAAMLGFEKSDELREALTNFEENF